MARNKFRYFFALFSFLLLLTSGCSFFSNTTDPTESRWANKYLIGTYYYLWYPGNWREGYINGRVTPPQLPVLGEYDSSDLKTIEQHITWSSRYGIDFWAISWWPDRSELDRLIKERLFKARNISDIKFCIFYETYGLGLAEGKIDFTPEKIKKIRSDFKYLARTYFSHPSYLKIKGRPVAIIYLSRTFSGAYPEALNSLRKDLKELGFNPYLIGDEIFWSVNSTTPLPSIQPNMIRIRSFDGITAYNMYNWAAPKQMGYGSTSTFLSDVHDQYRQYQSAIGKEINLIPSIFPGYNDRGVRLSENHQAIPRQFQAGGEEGSFFIQALKWTVLPFMDPNIHMALITTFNEWNEGTQIEPSQETGLTREDQSPTKTDYTQGYAYQGYGEKYLAILQDTFMAISGQVIDEIGGTPLAKVSLHTFKGKSLMAVTQTDSQGFYNLSRLNLPPGFYEIKANFPGYQEIISKVQVQENRVTIFNLKLKKGQPRS